MTPAQQASAPNAIRPRRAPGQTRIVASGTLTLAAGAQTLYRSKSGFTRRQFVISNLSRLYVLKVKTTDGLEFCTVQPTFSLTLEMSDDFIVKNPDATESVDYEVGEIYWFHNDAELEGS